MNIKIENRVFANKPLDFNKIRAVGISVEHVLVQYTPDFYELVYKLIKQRLIKKNKFPEEIDGLRYYHLMHAAASVIDKQHGTALQIDEFGNIHKCYHGSQLIDGKELLRLYPSKAIKWNESRYYLSQCALDQVQIQLYQQLVQYFEERYSGVVEPLIGTRNLSDVNSVGINQNSIEQKSHKLVTDTLQNNSSSQSNLSAHAIQNDDLNRRESLPSEFQEIREINQNQSTEETQNQLYLQNALTSKGLDQDTVVQNVATLATIADLVGSRPRSSFGSWVGVQNQSYLDYFALFTDVNSAFKNVMSFKTQLLESMEPDIKRYAIITDEVKNLLKKWKRTKLIFVHTSQQPEYVLALLKSLFGPEKWDEFIDFIIISETRRGFFLGDKPFRQYYPPQSPSENTSIMGQALKKDPSQASFNGRGLSAPVVESTKSSYEVTKGIVGLGWVGQELRPGQVYINGNVGDFERLTGVQPKHVLYCCEKFLRQEQIYRSGLWHFCHILPHLGHELAVINNNVSLFRRCVNLKVEQQHILASNNQQHVMDSGLLQLKKAIQEVGDYVNECFGPFGSCYMTTWGLTKLGGRLYQHCDLYTSKLENFIHYAPFHMFSVVLQNRYVPHQYALIQSLIWSKQQCIIPQNQPVVSEEIPAQQTMKAYCEQNQNNYSK